MAESVPYLGAKLSLISGSYIRYEGTLYTIDPREATVALQNVRCFGTESRVTDPSRIVAATDDLYDFIIFRGKDIIDLHVCEQPAAALFPALPKPPQDPAILSSSVPLPSAPAPAQVAPIFNAPNVPPPSPYYPQQDANYHAPHVNRRPYRDNRERRDDRREFRNNRRDHQDSADAAPPAEFDFAQSNARFDKQAFLAGLHQKSNEAELSQPISPEQEDAEIKALQNSIAAVKIEPKYDKSKGFFDSLSSDRNDRERESHSRRTDAETFGPQAENYRSRHNPRGHPHRGGYQGGRGGGFRGGRGNYRGGNSNRGPKEWRDYEYHDRDERPRQDFNNDNYQSRPPQRGRGRGRNDDYNNADARQSWRNDNDSNTVYRAPAQ